VSSDYCRIVQQRRPSIRRTGRGVRQTSVISTLQHWGGATRATLPGSPGESHPRAPTERNVTVSRHSALLTQSVRTWAPMPSGQTVSALVA
jgi:hypothetical protein